MKVVPHGNLEDVVLAAYRRAIAERRFDVAEPLLQALELLAGADDPGGSTGPSSTHLQAAYRLVTAIPNGQ